MTVETVSKYARIPFMSCMARAYLASSTACMVDVVFMHIDNQMEREPGRIAGFRAHFLFAREASMVPFKSWIQSCFIAERKQVIEPQKNTRRLTLSDFTAIRQEYKKADLMCRGCV